MPDKQSGIEEMRTAVRLFDSCREEFNERYNAHELLQIYRAHRACKWDVYPDQWADRQLSWAVSFGENGAPDFREITREDYVEDASAIFRELRAGLEVVDGNLTPVYSK